MLAVDVHPDVYAELEHSRKWYDERAANLGTDFLDEVDRAVRAVRQAPSTWPFYDSERDIRRYLVHRFPYGVIYRVKDPVIQILAVMHLRRRPDYWRGRLRDSNSRAGGPYKA